MPKQRLVDDERVISTYNETKAVNKTAEMLGLGTATVSRILNKNNVVRHPVDHRADKYMKFPGFYGGSKEEILDMYRSGLSMRDIAKKIGRSTTVVVRVVKKAGISRPYQGSGPDHSMWKGERVSTGNGYWKVWVSPDDLLSQMRDFQGYVKEHRLVMARKMGRALRRTESVHHIDGDPNNNAPSNLELRQGLHGQHVVMRCLNCGSHNVGYAPLASPGNYPVEDDTPEIVVTPEMAAAGAEVLFQMGDLEMPRDSSFAEVSQVVNEFAEAVFRAMAKRSTAGSASLASPVPQEKELND